MDTPPNQLGASPLLSWTAGLLIGFYALSATVIIPRFGAASFVAYILIGVTRRIKNEAQAAVKLRSTQTLPSAASLQLD